MYVPDNVEYILAFDCQFPHANDIFEGLGSKERLKGSRVQTGVGVFRQPLNQPYLVIALG
jgi:hypothetical protein